jgi:hypothetical protein
MAGKPNASAFAGVPFPKTDSETLTPHLSSHSKSTPVAAQTQKSAHAPRLPLRRRAFRLGFYAFKISAIREDVA